MATKNLKAILTIGGSIHSSLGAAFSRTNSELDTVGKSIRNVRAEQRKLAKEIAEASKNGPAQVGHLTDAYHKLGAELTKLQQQQRKLRAEETATLARMETRAKMKNGMVGAAVATAGEGALVGSAVSKSSNFNYKLAGIGVTAGKDKEAVAQFRKEVSREIVQLGRDTNQGAEKMVDSLGFLIAAGMEFDTAKDSLKSIGRTATASSAEIEDVAKASFTLNDALKIKPEGLQDALDILITAGKQGNFEFKAMAKNLPALGASFASLKITGNEAAATMGAALQIVRKGAGDEEEAANNLKNLLAKILSPETLKKAKKMGVDLEKVIKLAQAKGENPLEAAMVAINKMTKGGDLKLLGDLFQDMQVQNAVKPLLQYWDEYKKIKAESLRGKGVVDRDFITMSDTSKIQLERISNGMYELGVRIGSALEPVVVALGQHLVPLIYNLSDWADKNPGLASGITAVVVGATALTTGIFALGFASTFLAPAMGAAAVGIKTVGTAFRFVGGALVWVTRALLLNPIGAVVTALAVGAYLIYENWGPIKEFFSKLWDDIASSPKLQWVLDKLSMVGDGIKRAKSWFSSNSDGAPANMPPMATAPALAAAGGGRGPTTQNYNINVQAAPGQSPAAIAGAVAAKAGAKGGQLGQLYDGVAW